MIALLATATTPAPPPAVDKFTDANMLAALLTLEALAFAIVTMGVTLAAPQLKRRRQLVKPQMLANLSATLVTLLAVAAACVWFEIFITDWPGRVLSAIAAVLILVAIVAQAVLAWIVAHSATTLG